MRLCFYIPSSRMHAPVVFLVVILTVTKNQSFAAPLLNVYCDTDYDCSLMLGESICDEGHTCICKEDEGYYNEMTRQCDKMQDDTGHSRMQGLESIEKPQAIQGNSCNDKTDCDDQLGNYSVHQCVKGLCVCHKDSVTSLDNKSCVCKTNFVTASNGSACLTVASGLHDKCLEDVQCSHVNYSACVHSTCVCKENYHKWQNECHHIKMLGDECNTKSDCITLNATCDDHVCTCAIDYVSGPKAEKCFPKARLNGACTENIQCSWELSDNMSCSEGYCVNNLIARAIISSGVSASNVIVPHSLVVLLAARLVSVILR